MEKLFFVPFLIVLIAFCTNLSAFDGDAWLVAGDKVRVRATPSANGAIIAEVKAGTVVRVLKKSEARDKFPAGDNFGFYWYHSEIPGGKKGWIYGKFLYQMNGERFSLNEGVFRKSFVINGKKYDFTTKTGGGMFSITAIQAKECMIITGYKVEKESDE